MRVYCYGVGVLCVLLAAGSALVGCPPAAQVPAITTQPTSSTVTTGAAASFTVAASGTAPFTYQWYKDSVAVSGGTLVVLDIASAQASDAGSYVCVVSNPAGSATSNAATLTVQNPGTAPAITTQPASLTVTTASPASFTVAASGTDPLSYQWQKDGAALSGATGATLSIASAQSTDAGSYVCVVTNAAGSATSSAATLTVQAPVAPAITTQPVSQTVAPNAQATFSVVATGTAPLTYQWQLGGTAVSGATAANYAINLATSANSGTYTCVVSNAGGSATSNSATLTVFAIQIQAMNPEQFTPADPTKSSSGLSNVGIGTDVYLAADPADSTATYAWTVTTKPPNSSPSLSATSGPNIVFQPDLEGTYTVQVTGGTAGASVTASVEITAGDYVGVGIVTPTFDSTTTATSVVPNGITGSTCVACHNSNSATPIAPDEITPWLGTLHSTMFARGVDGYVSASYSKSCAQCHTDGFNAAPSAVNGGFDDVAKALNWVFPTPLQPGNWAAMSKNYPTLAVLANIQCENCHGPASQHPANALNPNHDIKMAKSLDPGVCAQCHYGHHPQYDQWVTSAHADSTAQAFTDPVGNSSCARCHTGGGYIDFMDGVPAAQERNSFQVITCAVCHDPHDNSADNHQLRATTVQLPGDAAPRTDQGNSATCMNCHNGRRTPDSATAAKPSFPHHSTASDILLGINGITFGVNLASSPHSTYPVQCVDCHMAATPASGPGVNLVGGHTYKITTPDPNNPTGPAIENVANACNGCHTQEPLTTVDKSAKGDYDGNGKIEGVQEEVKGLLALVLAQILATGATHSGSGGSPWAFTSVPAAQLANAESAAWNYDLVNNEGSFGVHNTKYAVGLLQLTYKQLAGKDVPNATLYYR